MATTIWKTRELPLLSRRRTGRWPRARRTREGFALVLCLFVVSMMTVWVVSMLASQTIHFAALRNITNFERALYLANAGVHHAAAELEQDVDWRGTVTAGSYPADGSYSATAIDDPIVPGEVLITSSGVAGEVTRKLQATVQVN